MLKKSISNYEVLLELEQGTKEWLDFRKGKFSASIIADCIGVKGAFRSQRDRALIMQGLKKEDFSKSSYEKMNDGLLKESEIREFISGQYDEKIIPCVIQSKENPQFIASLDGVGLKSGNVYEFKYSKPELEYVRLWGKPSDKYYAQVQFQLMIKDDADLAVFAVSFNGEFADVIVKRDAEFISDMLEKIEAFKDKFLYADLSKDAELMNDEQSLSLASEYLDLKELISQKEARMNEIKDILIKRAESLGDKCECGGLVISKSLRQSVDYKSFLAKNRLEIPPDFIKAKEVWSVRG